MFELVMKDVTMDCRMIFETEEMANKYADGRGSKKYVVKPIETEPRIPTPKISAEICVIANRIRWPRSIDNVNERDVIIGQILSGKILHRSDISAAIGIAQRLQLHFQNIAKNLKCDTSESNALAGDLRDLLECVREMFPHES